MAETTALSLPERQWRSVATLGWPLALLGAPAVASLGDLPLCGFRHLTGLPCPLCGGTRVCVALVQGNLEAAWAANPGLLLLLGLVAAQTVLWGAQAWTGCPLYRWHIGAWAWAAGLGVLLAGWLLRLTGNSVFA